MRRSPEQTEGNSLPRATACRTDGGSEKKLCMPQLLDMLEDEAKKQTDLYIGDVMNPMIAPFAKGGKDMAKAEGFWTWDAELERYFHDDEDTGIRVFFPKTAIAPGAISCRGP